MTIAVLMSVYKSEKPAFLDRALQSVWDDQSYKPAQIVLIQDGPLGDELAQVIETWKQKLGDVLTLVVNAENIGLTKSLNKGIKEVKTDLIARMDSDDKSVPVRFELQVKFLREHPDIAVVGGAVQEFNSVSPCLKVRHYPKTDREIRKYIAKACPLAHPSVMMRASMFEKVKYDERYRMSQDIALWYDALCAGFKIGNIDDIVLFFRREGDVYNRRGRAKAWNEFCIYMGGIKRLYGIFSWRYVYPISRLVFRLMPIWVIKRVYDSQIRQKLLSSKN